MSKGSTISWTNDTWNPVRGCSKVSVGCKNCYAETFAERWRGIPGHAFEQGFDLRLVPEKLDEPLHWKKPRRIFVNSMSDLFHEKVPFEYIDRVWHTMAEAHQHIYQILTKRPERMLEFFEWTKTELKRAGLDEWWKGYTVMPHVHLGVSVENQDAADKRIPILLQVPAAVRFLSCEPLLGPVDLRDGLWVGPEGGAEYSYTPRNMISWVIVGGESGHGCRPMDLDWARSIRDQCRETGTAFFMKQTGGARDKGESLESIPEDLRFREYPRSRQ